MPLIVRDTEGDTRDIAVSGSFTFDVLRDFRKVYLGSVKGKKYVLDLRDVEYLDRSALGMILLLREFVGEDSKRLRVINSKPDIKNIFAVSSMDKIIEIA